MTTWRRYFQVKSEPPAFDHCGVCKIGFPEPRTGFAALIEQTGGSFERRPLCDSCFEASPKDRQCTGENCGTCGGTIPIKTWWTNIQWVPDGPIEESDSVATIVCVDCQAKGDDWLREQIKALPDRPSGGNWYRGAGRGCVLLMPG